MIQLMDKVWVAPIKKNIYILHNLMHILLISINKHKTEREKVEWEWECGKEQRQRWWWWWWWWCKWESGE